MTYKMQTVKEYEYVTFGWRNWTISTSISTSTQQRTVSWQGHTSMPVRLSFQASNWIIDWLICWLLIVDPPSLRPTPGGSCPLSLESGQPCRASTTPRIHSSASSSVLPVGVVLQLGATVSAGRPTAITWSVRPQITVAHKVWNRQTYYRVSGKSRPPLNFINSKSLYYHLYLEIFWASFDRILYIENIRGVNFKRSPCIVNFLNKKLVFSCIEYFDLTPL